MLQLSAQLLTVLFASNITSTIGLSLEDAKKQACRENVKVSAILKNKENKSYEYLFSGDLLFTVKVPDLTLEDVQEIEDKFPGVRGRIEASLYSSGLKTYFFAREHDIVTFTDKDGASRLEYQKFYRWMEKTYDMKKFDDKFNCATSYNDDPVTMVYVDFNGKASKCRMAEVRKGHKEGRSICTEGLPIPNPGNIGPQEFEGASCEGLSISKVEEPDVTYRLLLAEKKKLRLWHDSELANEVDLNDLFDCSSVFVHILIGGIVLFCIIAVIIVATLAFLFVRRSGKREIENSTDGKICSIVSKDAKTIKY